MPRRPLVLIVEDDRVLRELYRMALSVANFDVEICADGWSALQYLEQERPDLIVLDLDLPRVSGIDIYKELRAHAVTHSVPIVVCTGSDAAESHLPGATILRKPCAPEQVIATIEQELRPRQRAWLYARGEESVRIVWEGGNGEPTQLFVYGPGMARAVFYDTDSISCTIRQVAIERTLLAEGYVELPLFFGDRRSGDERRATPRESPDRRRQAE